MTSRPGSVLDASALLAFLHREPGAEFVAGSMRHGAWISAVNWSEVLSKLAEAGQGPEAVRRTLIEHHVLGILLHIHPFDEADAAEVARLRPLTRTAGLSLGDRACLALGHRLGLPVLTADRTWLDLDVGVRVEAVR